MKIVKKYFLSGVLVVVPIILTYLVLRVLFNALDSILQPLILKVFSIDIPGLGLIATFLLILIAGIITRNLIGSQLVGIWDRIIERLPVIRPIYSASKQLLEAMTSSGSGSFKEVVLVEYPRTGTYALGFLAQHTVVEIGEGKKDMVTVFIPHTPAPMSGIVIFVPANEAYHLDMTVEAGFSYVVSGGVALPKVVKGRVPKAQTVQGNA